MDGHLAGDDRQPVPGIVLGGEEVAAATGQVDRVGAWGAVGPVDGRDQAGRPAARSTTMSPPGAGGTAAPSSSSEAATSVTDIRACASSCLGNSGNGMVLVMETP